MTRWEHMDCLREAEDLLASIRGTLNYCLKYYDGTENRKMRRFRRGNVNGQNTRSGMFLGGGRIDRNFPRRRISRRNSFGGTRPSNFRGERSRRNSF
jgi:hypothetical protein